MEIYNSEKLKINFSIEENGQFSLSIKEDNKVLVNRVLSLHGCEITDIIECLKSYQSDINKVIENNINVLSVLNNIIITLKREFREWYLSKNIVSNPLWFAKNEGNTWFRFKVKPVFNDNKWSCPFKETFIDFDTLIDVPEKFDDIPIEYSLICIETPKED
ncbi:MAG: hypothetical protein MJ247_01165 [Alphaproteobacteria bacterium]|nr:hypothetical protein [Alphaproteobacteria bacterium]